MTNETRPRAVDLSQFGGVEKGISPWLTTTQSDELVTALIADLQATRDERDDLQQRVDELEDTIASGMRGQQKLMSERDGLEDACEHYIKAVASNDDKECGNAYWMMKEALGND